MTFTKGSLFEGTAVAVAVGTELSFSTAVATGVVQSAAGAVTGQSLGLVLTGGGGSALELPLVSGGAESDIMSSK